MIDTADTLAELLHPELFPPRRRGAHWEPLAAIVELVRRRSRHTTGV